MMRMPRRPSLAASVSTKDGVEDSMSVALSTSTWMSALSTASSCGIDVSRQPSS